MFDPAGIPFRHFRVNACGDKLLGKETMSLIDFFGDLSAHIGKVEKVILVHCKKAAVFQSTDRYAYTWF